MRLDSPDHDRAPYVECPSDDQELVARRFDGLLSPVHQQPVPGGSRDRIGSRRGDLRRSLPAILAALPELEKRNLKIENHVVKVWQLHDQITVYFANPEDGAPAVCTRVVRARDGASE